jgi:hypothetical protein
MALLRMTLNKPRQVYNMLGLLAIGLIENTWQIYSLACQPVDADVLSKTI